MAEYWVNINASYNFGTHAGTSIDPYTYDQLVASLPTSVSDTYNIKGVYDGVDELAIDALFRGWNLASNGPWRIRGVTSGGNISDAIVELANDLYLYSYNGLIVNSIFKAPAPYVIDVQSVGGASPLNFKGCSFYANLTMSVGGPIVNIKDCIIKSHTYEASATVTFDNCVFGDGPKVGWTYNNCQFNTSIPAAPAWDAAQSAFASNVLGAGILSDPPNGSAGKPNPGVGAPSYTGYATGLWGSARTGIGAMDFGEPAPPVTCWNFSALYKGTKRFFRVNGPGSCPNQLEIPRNVDLSTGCMIEHGKKVDFSRFKIL